MIKDGRNAREYAFTERAAREARKLYSHKIEGAGAF